MWVLIFCVFLRDPRKKFPPKKKLPPKTFPAKIYSTVDILMVSINCGTESDSEDEEEYHSEYENTIDNPLDNASSGNVVIVDPSTEQSDTPGVDVILKL